MHKPGAEPTHRPRPEVDSLTPTRPERFLGEPLGDLVGEEVGGYRIEALLGQGAMGRVYKARDLRLGRFAALKFMAAPLSLRGELAARFQREIQALAALRHPKVAQIYTAGEFRGVPYFAMEYIAGGSLGEMLERTGRLSGRRCLDYLIDAAEGLWAAHEAGIVHRDVKPSNLMLDASGHLKIVDFGIARRLDEDSALTRTHGTLGTPLYLAPEQALGQPVDHRTDVYSLGAAFYHLFAGEPPFQGDTAVGLAMQHVQAPLVPLRRRNPRVPRSVEAIIGKMMAKRPEDRYPSYSALIEDLRRARAGKAARHATAGGQGRDEPVIPGSASDPGHRRALWMATGSLLAVAVVLVLAFGGGDHGGGEVAPLPEPAPAAGRQPENPLPGATPPAPEAEPDSPEPWPPWSPREEPVPAERPDDPFPVRDPPRAAPRRRPPPAPSDKPLPDLYRGAFQQALRAKSLAALRQLANGVEVYMAEEGTPPADLPTLAAHLRLNPRALLDGWGRKIRYRPLDGDRYRLLSTGADGRAGTEDDLVMEDGYVVQGELSPPAWLQPDPR